MNQPSAVSGVHRPDPDRAFAGPLTPPAGTAAARADRSVAR
ncbi:hypothetical protein SAMN05216223_118152 [Actinacidiphila yanglinensis]|uniref:Uncharacterized protein n=1 Tax=Actinacidiphila yanglinensis TaxID=310779 RepID=A0A1H6DSM9_9ACTN|nr:hypothetical protein [Actinacidiphila yanglinensis]SEG87723.1 hypothetical protein SAMN05216223_118152 [Actinacidiphila yanglinensis]